MKNKVLFITLIIFTLLLLPNIAFADGETQNPWEQLSDALQYAEDIESKAFQITKPENGHRTITLTADIKNEQASGAGLTITNTVDLDLNGHTLDGNNKPLFTIKNGGALTIFDSSANKTGKIQNGKTDDSGGAFNITNYSSLTLESGTITSCSAGEGGGAICITSGTFNMNGGLITNCYSMGYSGWGGGAVLINKNCTMTMTAGEISQNRTYNTGDGGGISNEGNFVMTGGVITKNFVPYSNTPGGGVSNYGNTTVGGSAVISGNTQFSDDYQEDLYTSSTRPIKIATGADAPTTMNIGIKLYNGYGSFADTDIDLSNYFFANNADGHELVYKDGKMQLVLPKPITKIEENTLNVKFVYDKNETLKFAAATYDTNDKMLSCELITKSLSAEKAIDLSFNLSPNRTSWKVFILDNNCKPIDMFIQ